MNWNFVLLLIGILQSVGVNGSIADWFGSSKDDLQESLVGDHPVRDDVIMPNVPFEAPTNDERYDLFGIKY